MMGSPNSFPKLSYKEKRTEKQKEKKKKILCNSSKKTKISRVQNKYNHTNLSNISVKLFSPSIEKNLEEIGKDRKKESKTHKYNLMKPPTC